MKGLSRLTQQVLRMSCALLALWLSSPLAAEEKALETPLENYEERFYDGLVVKSQRFSGEVFVATVSKVWPTGRRQPLARYTLDVERARGEWWAFGTGTELADLRTFEYASTHEGDDLSRIVASHTVKSVARSALLLWEESQGGEEVATRAYGQGCAGCNPTPNGCSGWSDTCNGRSVQAACNRHDICYRCGSYCEGMTRPQCDAQFRQEVQAATQSSECARIYWLGVRAMGWLFMQHPESRNSMQPDVYSLGIALTACPSGYTHLCTIYLF